MSFALAGRLSQRVRLPKAVPWAESFRPCRAFRKGLYHYKIYAVFLLGLTPLQHSVVPSEPFSVPHHYKISHLNPKL